MEPIEIVDASIAVDYESAQSGSGEELTYSYLNGFIMDTPNYPVNVKVDFFSPAEAAGNPYPLPDGLVPTPATLQFSTREGVHDVRIDMSQTGLPGMEMCDQRTRLNGWTVTFGLSNFAPLPQDAVVSDLIPCLAGDDGALNDALDITATGGCPDGTAGAELVEHFGVSAVKLTTCPGAADNRTTLGVPIGTPSSPFEVWFDYRFELIGELNVSLNDQPLVSLPDNGVPTFTRETVVISDPSLLGLENAALTFELVGDGSMLTLGNILSPVSAPSTSIAFRRGDDDASGTLDLSDPIFSLTFQFLGGDPPACMDALDTDDSGAVDVSDPIFNLTHQFLGGSPPPAPGKESCGPDPSDDELGCDSFPEANC